MKKAIWVKLISFALFTSTFATSAMAFTITNHTKGTIGIFAGPGESWLDYKQLKPSETQVNCLPNLRNSTTWCLSKNQATNFYLSFVSQKSQCCTQYHLCTDVYSGKVPAEANIVILPVKPGMSDFDCRVN